VATGDGQQNEKSQKGNRTHAKTLARPMKIGNCGALLEKLANL